MMGITRVKYTGSTPGANTTPVEIFSSVTAGWPKDHAVRHGIHTFNWDIFHGSDGAVTGQKLDEAGTWRQFYDSTNKTAGSTSSKGTVLVEGLPHFRFYWTNAAAVAQTAFAINMDFSVFP